MKKFLVLLLCLYIASLASASNVDKVAIEEALAAYEAGMELTKDQDALLSKHYDNRSGGDVIDNAGGPDAFGYTWEDSEEVDGPVYAWYDISATGTSIIGQMGDDVISASCPIGFSFPFYGFDYTNFYVGSNGIIVFDGTYVSYTNSAIPAPGLPAMIAWFWDDLDPGDASDADVLYETMVINNRNALVVSFLNWDQYPGNSNPNGQSDITAQVILFDNGLIAIHYMSVEYPDFDIAGCTIGIQNNDGAIGLSALYNGSIAGYPYDELAIEFGAIWPSELIVTPMIMNFGSIMEGETAIVPLQMTPSENSPVIIDSYLFEFPTGFSMDMTLPYTIEPEEVVEFDVTFAPTDDADWSSNLWIHSDALNETVTVELIANATTGVLESDEELLPTTLEVAGAYPNPFNASTMIKIRAPYGRTIEATIYDIRGREIHRYKPYCQGGNTTQLVFEADALPSGLYFCHITDGITSVSQKMVLLK